MDSVGIWLEQQTLAWLPVDPETFVKACLEMEVWTEWEASDALEAMQEFFEEDSVAATHRFLDVACALYDDTLVEFTFETDEGEMAIPTAIFWAAATAPFDDAGEMLDRRAWRVATMAVLSECDEDCD